MERREHRLRAQHQRAGLSILMYKTIKTASSNSGHVVIRVAQDGCGGRQAEQGADGGAGAPLGCCLQVFACSPPRWVAKKSDTPVKLRRRRHTLFGCGREQLQYRQRQTSKALQGQALYCQAGNRAL